METATAGRSEYPGGGHQLHRPGGVETRWVDERGFQAVERLQGRGRRHTAGDRVLERVTRLEDQLAGLAGDEGEERLRRLRILARGQDAAPRKAQEGTRVFVAEVVEGHVPAVLAGIRLV